jgi:hypothetical protein
MKMGTQKMQFVSIEIDDSDLHRTKHNEQRIATLRGMTIDQSQTLESTINQYA